MSVDDERASEQGDDLDGRDALEARKTYARPQLTRWGAIAKTTQQDDDGGSGIQV
jgi:hypothetical protein